MWHGPSLVVSGYMFFLSFAILIYFNAGGSDSVSHTYTSLIDSLTLTLLN